MIRTGKSLLVFILLLIPLLATAKISVTATVDSDEVTVGEPFPLAVTVSSDEEAEMQVPRPPDLDGFQMLSQSRSQSVHQQLVQGPHGMEFQTQRSMIFRYDLQPQRQGRLSIGAFTISVNGKEYRTQPIVLNAIPPGTPGKQQQRQVRPHRGQDPLEDMMDEADAFDEELFKQLLQQRQQVMKEPQVRTMPINPNEAFFVQVEADKTDVFENEQITVNWYIYTRGRVESLDRAKFPDLKGFWKEIIEENPAIQFTEEIVNGIPYHKALLASHALFPIKPGPAIIDEFKLKARVRLLGQGGFGFGPAYEYTRASKKIIVNVKPLPNEGRPRSFTGAVGTFQVHAVTEKEQVPLNQPFSVRIRFEGAGNAKLIELPSIEWPQGLEVYDTKSESKYFKNGTSYKEFEVLVIPRQKGKLTIPSFEFSFFDPNTKKYTSQKTDPINVDVVDNPNAVQSGGSERIGSDKSKPSVANKPGMPAPVTEWVAGASAGGIFQRLDVMIVIYLLAFLLLAWRALKVFGFMKRQPKLKQLVEKRRKKMEQLFKEQKWRQGGVEGVNALHYLVGALLGERGGTREFQTMLSELPSTIPETLKARTKDLFNDLQTLGFAPDHLVQSYSRPENIQKLEKDFSSVVDDLLKYGEGT